MKQKDKIGKVFSKIWDNSWLTNMKWFWGGVALLQGLNFAVSCMFGDEFPVSPLIHTSLWAVASGIAWFLDSEVKE